VSIYCCAGVFVDGAGTVFSSGKMGKKKRTRSKRRKEKRDETVETAGAASVSESVAQPIAESVAEPASSEEAPVLKAASPVESPPPPERLEPASSETIISEPASSETIISEPAASEPEVPFSHPAIAQPSDLSPQTIVAEIAVPRPEPEPEIVPFVESTVIAAPVSDQVVSAAPTVTPAPDEEPVQLARLWRRLAAFVYDVLLLVLLNLVLFLAALYKSTIRFMEPVSDTAPAFQPAEAKHYFVLAAGIGIFVSWLYMTALEALPPGATLGKQIFSIRTADLNGKRVSFARSNLRVLAKVPSIFSFGIGCLIALFRRDRKALHDILAKTQVVTK